jgi:hypothetical protein
MCVLDVLWVSYKGLQSLYQNNRPTIPNKLFDGHYGSNVLSILASI